MAQHDYVIDNSTGANVRADINNALLAISSNNSGSSAPSTTYALQSFANTTSTMLQLRNAANNAFVNLRKFDGSCPLPDGTNSAPSLFFDDDTNTGIYSSAADTLNIATGGTERLELGTTTIFNEDGADVDFRIEGDTDANLFYVDAGNDRIGISTANPTGTLSIESGTYQSTAPDTTGDDLVISGNQSLGMSFITAAGGSSNNNIYFGDTDDTNIGMIRYAHADNSLQFQTNASEQMRIDSSGRVGIGTSSPTKALHVSGSSSPEILLAPSDASPALFIGDSNRSADGQHLAEFGARWNGTKVARIVMQAGDDTTNKDNGQLVFLTAAAGSTSERLRINEQGDVGINESSPSGRLHVNGGAGLLVERSAGTSIAGFKHSGSSTMNIYFQNTGSTNHPYVGSESQDLTIGTNNVNRIKVNSTGDTAILAVNVYEGGRSLDVTSTSAVTFFTFSNNQANAFVARFTATENNNTTGYIVTGSVVGNQITQAFMADTNHAHSKDILFSLAGTGNTQLQVRASQYTTTRRVRLIDIFVSAGRPTYA